MATSPSAVSHVFPFQRPSAGVALVIVLAFLVLLSGLVVAFFITTTTDVVASRNYAQETTAKELSDAAVNLVISQVTDATAGFASGVGTTGTLAWASQPGMIRTWDDAGNFYKAFKLYSSDQLVASGADFNPTADFTALATWNAGASTKAYNALYADLNSPVKDVAGTLHYPIMDPSGDDGGLPVASTDTTSIEGFHITAPPGYNNGNPAGPGNDPAPMPVKWLYVLADGTLAPTGAGAVPGTHVTVGTNGTNTPTAANPIVGRVAFWADDDTCKVNLNTASEGVFWDLPRTDTYEDHCSNDLKAMGYATSVPSNTEFQRIPGHPATTSLSTVLGYHFGRRPGYITAANYPTFLQPYYDLLPRVATGGTNGGTYYNPNGSGPNIVGRRLFASVDELLFAPPTSTATTTPTDPLVLRNTNGVVPNGNGAATTAFTKADIEKVRFFLTTNSRAPDVNLFNKPRVSLWPLMSDPDAINNSPNSSSGTATTYDSTAPSRYRNSKDDLLAFCASVGVDPATTASTKLDARTSKIPYYFQRFQPFVFGGQGPGTNNYADNYANPGSSQSPYDDLTQTSVKRNVQLLNYLHTLTNLNVPGIGGSLAAKYPQDNDQILTEAFDYVRSTVNTSSLNSTYTLSNYNYAPNDINGSWTAVGAGSVVPIYNNQVTTSSTPTMGFVRWSVISEVSILFWATEVKDTSTFGAVVNGVQQPPTTGTDHAHPLPDGLPDDEPLLRPMPDPNNPNNTIWQVYYRGVGMPRTKSVEAAVLITPTTVTPGNPLFAPALRYEITGLNNFSVTWNGNKAGLNLPADAIQTIHSNTGIAFDAEANFYDQLSYGLSPNGPNTPILAMTAAQAQASTSGTLGGPIGRPPQTPQAPMSTLTPFVSTAPAQIGGYDISISPAAIDVTNYPPPCAYQPTWNDPGKPGPDAYGDALPAYDHTYIWGGDGTTQANANDPAGVAARRDKPYTMAFSGGSIQIKVYSGLYTQINAANPSDDGSAQPLQIYTLNFPPCTIPVPQIARAVYGTGGNFNSSANPTAPVSFPLALQTVVHGGTTIGGPRDLNLDFYTGWNIPYANVPSSGTFPSSSNSVPPTATWNASPLYINSPDPNLQNLVPWNTRVPYVPQPQQAQTMVPYANPSGPAPSGFGGAAETLPAIARHGDVVRSISLDPGGPAKGDFRILAATHDVPASFFAPLTYTDQRTGTTCTRYGSALTVNPYWQDMYWTVRGEGDINSRNPIGYFDDLSINNGDPRGVVDSTNHALGPVPNLRLWPSRGELDSRGRLVQGVPYGDYAYHTIPPVISLGLNGAMLTGRSGAQAPGDWDNGVGNYYDGAYINKADEGYGENGVENPYFPAGYHYGGGTAEGNAVGSYAPNRQIPSPVMFGSLPTGVIAQKPWQTLLFCPNPAAGDDHPGFGTSTTGIGSSALPPYTVPPDHVFLDLFYTPVVDPYAISEAFSTAGRINMNYQIQPFTNVERSTAVRAVLKGMKIQAVGAGAGALPDFGPPDYFYKETFAAGYISPWSSRYDINVDATLTGFTNRFANSGLFRSASEICNIFLVPQDPDPNAGYPWTVPQQVQGDAPSGSPAAAYASTKAWWTTNNTGYAVPGYALTGDNARESPYNQVYPRLTTKSNTFTVHVRVQVLKKQAGSVANTWDETKDQVLSEYRGSASLERYIDPNDPNLPDFATGALATGTTVTSTDPRLNMDSYYRFRIVSTKQFQP